jgi:hypothetical protein
MNRCWEDCVRRWKMSSPLRTHQLVVPRQGMTTDELASRAPHSRTASRIQLRFRLEKGLAVNTQPQSLARGNVAQQESPISPFVWHSHL